MKPIKIMIVGGCFDLLHPGHLDFLKKARDLCDYLVVLLEPDEKVKIMKGAGRPKTNLESRIRNLEKTGLVDKITVLPVLKTDKEYSIVIPDLIGNLYNKSLDSRFRGNDKVSFSFGITKNDRNHIKNEKIRVLAMKLKIPVLEVNELLPGWSTSKLIGSL